MTLPFPIQFASNGPQWAQGFDAWYDYTKPQGSQLLAFPPATDTHSAAVSAQSSFGGWQAIPANVPSRTDLGLQTVPTRTNSIRNNSMSGAVAGSPGTLPTNWVANPAGGLTPSVFSVTTALGLPLIGVRYTGTASATGGVFLEFDVTLGVGVPASPSQVWAQSLFAYYSINSGATPSSFINRLAYKDAGGGNLGQSDTTISLTTSIARYRSTGTTPASTASIIPTLRIGIVSGQTYDFVVWVAAPQLELGAFASAPILTTSGAATVNGNQQVVDLTGRLGSGVGLIMQFNPLDVTALYKQPISFNDGTSNNYLNVYMDTGGGTPLSQIFNATINQGNVTMPGANATGVQTWVIAAGPNYHRTQKIGQAASTTDTTVSWPTTLSKMNIGGNGYSAADNMYQLTRRLALRFGAANDAMFNDLVAKATILNAVS